MKITHNILSLTTVLLVGCGGGGDAATPATTTFPLLAGYKTLTAAGGTNNYSIAGSCSGSATISDGAAIAATFEGVIGYSTATTLTINLTNCTPATSTSSGTSYYDANYAPLGSSIPGGEYAKVVTVPPPLPASVKVGDTATYASFTVYADSTKATVTGSRTFGYAVQAGTTSTAIVNVTAKDYDTSNNLLFTQLSRYRIAADGTLTSTTIDLQYSTSSTLHLILTKV